jgi:hypothetical protein
MLWLVLVQVLLMKGHWYSAFAGLRICAAGSPRISVTAFSGSYSNGGAIPSGVGGEHFEDRCGYGAGQERRDGIAHLSVLLSARTDELESVGE